MTAILKAYRIETTLTQDGTLTLDQWGLGLPLGLKSGVSFQVAP